MPMLRNGQLVEEDVPLRNAMNELLRHAYMKDCERVVKRWNASLEEEGSRHRITLPSSRFFRRQGIYVDACFDPQGDVISRSEWESHRDGWLPSDADRAYVAGLMTTGVTEPGKMAHWIAAPRKGINGQALDYEYVRREP